MDDLSPERWRQVEDLLDEALDLDPDERSAFLKTACPDDPELRNVVERLLRADDAAGAFLEQPAGMWASSLFEDETPRSDASLPVPDPGTQIGPYRLVEEVGRGGMGVVYLGERADGAFDQRVAVKLIASPDPGSVERRFRSERQILAQLHHPNIARLFDGGVTDDGRPYFVMEYVEGQPIDAYCDERELSIDERLQLFNTVIEAVEHAHRNLVVHRDLKPSNVLVDAEGRVKLLDFGIAKLLDADGEESITRTGVGVRMTPAYAAPEQVRGDAISTATDVYQLGVLAYKLLSGHRPLRFETNAPMEVSRKITEEIPDPPSQAVQQEVEHRRSDGTSTIVTAETVSQARNTDPSTLRRTLHGDLDAVVMKALRKDPTDRYASAGAFSNDVDRYLSALPVEARVPTAGYRVRKFLRRHRWGVGVLAAFVLMVIGFSVFYTTRISAERDRAQQHAKEAERVSSFLADLFVASNPFEEVKGDTLLAQDLLRRGANRIDSELDDEPHVQATMMQVIGEVYHRRGEYEQADSLLTRAYEQWTRQVDGPSTDIAKNIRLRSELLHQQGQYAKAESLAREALELDRALHGEQHPTLGDDLFLMGLAHHEQGAYAEAESLHQRALRIRRQTSTKPELSVARSFGELERAAAAQGEYAKAESLQERSLDLHRQVFGPNHPRVAQEIHDAAYLARRRGKYDEAERRYRKAIGILRETLGSSHPELGNPLNNLGILLGVQGRYHEAEPLFREALRIRRRHYGPEHPTVANSLHSLGRLMLEMGRLDSARTFAREALRVERVAVGEGHPAVAVKLDLLGRIHAERGAFEEAERFYRQALSVERDVREGAHPQIATELVNLAEMLVKQSKYSEAEPLLRKALSMNRELFDPGHPETAPVLHMLGDLLGRTGRYREGARLLRNALQIQREAFDRGHPSQIETVHAIIDLYDRWDKPTQAAAYRDTLHALEN